MEGLLGAATCRPDDLLGNVLRAGEWETDHELAKIGKPIDRDEWLMTPQTVNAYYHPRMNEIVFPAAILQPPFFDAEADDAANYGGIGAVIGHEIGHGFDDQGSKYDGDGNLTDWWEPDDRAEFERRAKALIAQYDALTPAGLPEHHVNGALTVGENIGDLGGLTIALKAYRIADRAAPSRRCSTGSPGCSGCCSGGRRCGGPSPATRRRSAGWPSTRTRRRTCAATPWSPTSTRSTRRSTCRRRTRCSPRPEQRVRIW